MVSAAAALAIALEALRKASAVTAPAAPATATPTPSDMLVLHGFKAASYDPLFVTTGPAVPVGVLHLARVNVPVAATVSAVMYCISAAITGPTAGQNGFAIYNAAGVKVADSVDQTTAFTSGTLNTAKTATLTAPVNLPAGQYVIAALTNGTTGVGFGRFSGTGPLAANLTADQRRFGQWGTARTSLPATIDLVSSTASTTPLWVALV